MLQTFNDCAADTNTVSCVLEETRKAYAFSDQQEPQKAAAQNSFVLAKLVVVTRH